MNVDELPADFDCEAYDAVLVGASIDPWGNTSRQFGTSCEPTTRR